jgi:hypothetical protein
MKTQQKEKKRAVKVQIGKSFDPIEILEYFKKNVKPRPYLDVVKWMEKHGR